MFQAVTYGPLAHSAHVEIILSFASGMNPSGFGKCSLSHTSLWLMYLEQYSNSNKKKNKKKGFLLWDRKKHGKRKKERGIKAQNVFQKPNFFLRSEFLSFPCLRVGFNGNRLLWPWYQGGNPVTQRSFSPGARCFRLKYAAHWMERGSLEARPWGKLEGEKKQSWSAHVFRVHGRKRIFDLSCDLLSSQEKRGFPRRSTTKDTAHEMLIVPLHQWGLCSPRFLLDLC